MRAIRNLLCKLGIHKAAIDQGEMTGRSVEYKLKHWRITKVLATKYCKYCYKKL